jgi:hypothetical protein
MYLIKERKVFQQSKIICLNILSSTNVVDTC